MYINFKTHTVESVTSGHPDKVCDQISDAILDALLARDPRSRVAVETFGSNDLLVVGGEVTSSAQVPYAQIAKKVYEDIGYTDPLTIKTHINTQSPDIAQGVDTGGAGDQGIMYGFASDESGDYLPRAVTLAHALTRGLEKLRRDDPRFSWLRPDGKAQVTVEDGVVTTILISTQHAKDISQEEIKKALTAALIAPLINPEAIKILINPTGSFVVGGFVGDTGLTGRKIMVDTYGGLIPHGGGAFSGKDPTKVDRSAAYMARFAAKNIVANGHAKKALVSVAYAIGKEEPLMVEGVNENGESIAPLLKQHFDFRPRAIIERLNLRRPLYQKTASYGHFGNPAHPWEEVVRF